MDDASASFVWKLLVLCSDWGSFTSLLIHWQISWGVSDPEAGSCVALSDTLADFMNRVWHRRWVLCDQTTVTKWAPIPCKWYGRQTPLKCFKNFPQKFHKAVQCNILWLNLNKLDILQSANKQGNPSFDIYAPGSKRRYSCTQTASAVPKYFPRLPQCCTGYCIWHASWAWKQKTGKKRWFSHS